MIFAWPWIFRSFLINQSLSRYSNMTERNTEDRYVLSPLRDSLPTILSLFRFGYSVNWSHRRYRRARWLVWKSVLYCISNVADPLNECARNNVTLDADCYTTSYLLQLDRTTSLFITHFTVFAYWYKPPR